MKKRKKIRIGAFSAALFVSLTAWGITGSVSSHRYKTEIELQNQKALTELCEYMDSIEVALTKSLYTNTDEMLGKLTSELQRSSAGAKENLSSLYSGETRLHNTYKFLSQVGQFTASLNKKAAKGEKISNEEREILTQLLSYAAELSLQFEHMASLLSADYFTFDEISDIMIKQDSGSEKTVSYLSGIADTELTFEDFPSLIYDGPYSDNILNKSSEMLEESAEISRDEARKIAAGIIGTEEKFLAEEEDTAGKTAAFCFRNDTYSVSVTKAGGYPLSLISDITVTETSLTQADAVEKASLFLGQLGFFDMVSTYAATDDGICTVNFAYKTGSFICYPDLIKVQVALSDGKITGFDASDYIMNHKKRDIPAFTFTPEDAAEGIVSSLDIQEISAAVIPTESGTEYFTYELLCEGEDGQHILIYKDILTLEEVDILILLYSDNGTLTK